MGVSLNTRAWNQSTDKDADTNTPSQTLSCLVLATDTNNTSWTRCGKTFNDFGSDFPSIPVKHGILLNSWFYSLGSQIEVQLRFKGQILITLSPTRVWIVG